MRTFGLVSVGQFAHKWEEFFPTMNFYSCFDQSGQVIARCQTDQEVEVLKKMGRPIAEVREMRQEEAVICSLTSSPSDFNQDY